MKHPLYECYQPPDRPLTECKVSVFFAGSIEMGKAPPWQKDLAGMLKDLPIAVFNPRRDDFDPNLRQDIAEEIFKQQVEWEMDYLSSSNLIAMYFHPGTLSPVTLAEFGHYVEDPRLTVCCPDGYWRKGNVQVMCQRYGKPLIETWEEFTKTIREKAERMCVGQRS